MTPKAQQMGAYDVPNDNNHQLNESKGNTNHQRNPSSSSDIVANNNHSNTNSSTSLLLNSITNRVSSAMSPGVIFLVATPIAMRYPLLQLIIFLTILVGTSPLYFIIITFSGKSNKHNGTNQCEQSHQPQPHRRQPSIVGSIADMKDDSKAHIINHNNIRRLTSQLRQQT